MKFPPLTERQRIILDALAGSGGALCAVELRRQINRSTSHLNHSLARLAARGLVTVTDRNGLASGPLIELVRMPTVSSRDDTVPLRNHQAISPASEASLPSASRAEARQARPGTP